MTFWEHFLRLLVRRPVPAAGALYWHVTRRKLRARNRLLAASADLPFAYDLWIARIERRSNDEAESRRTMDAWANRPRFSVVIHGTLDASEAQVRRSRESAEQQLYPAESITEEHSKALVETLVATEGDYVVPVRAGDLLSKNALFRFAEALQTQPDAQILYADHDHLDRRGRRSRPWFKPQWNEELFLAQDYLSSSVAVARGLCQRAGSRTDDLSNFLISATKAANNSILHVPHVLFHISSEPHSTAPVARVAAVTRHLLSVGASCMAGPFGTVRVQWPLPDPPLVTIIIPTKDKLELLQPCVESVLERTTYSPFEMIIVDNGSKEARTRSYLEQAARDDRVRVLPYDQPYNFSAINNFAAGIARGDFLCLLNNDTEVIEPEWLTEMMRYAVRPEIGAVGSKLLYDDGTIQHAGVIVGIGDAAGHAHRFLPAETVGYFGQAHVAQFVTAVTAACLVVAKEKFVAVDGLDQEELAVAFNDVDLCLKLQSAGWRNVYVPHAVLLHHESKSRGSDMSPQHIDRYRRELRVLQERWGTTTYKDPLHNPNLDRYSEKFVIRL